MKRVALILFAFVYLVSVTGILVSSICCLDKLSSLKAGYRLSSGQDKTCSDITGCCSRTQHVFKVNDTHVGSATLSVSRPYAGAILLCFTPGHAVQLPQNSYCYLESSRESSPPPPCIYKLYRNYRI